MHTPQQNLDGYEEATISNTTALGHCTRFLLCHGTRDDNAHVQNTLALVDRLNIANVTNYDMQIYPDSNHDIRHHNGRILLYRRM